MQCMQTKLLKMSTVCHVYSGVKYFMIFELNFLKITSTTCTQQILRYEDVVFTFYLEHLDKHLTEDNVLLYWIFRRILWCKKSCLSV